MAEKIKYERKTVQTVRGTASLVISTMEKEGWEFVDQTPGTVRTSLNFRRPGKQVRRLHVVAGVAGVVLLVSIIAVGAVREDDEEAPHSDRPTTNTQDGTGSAPQATETLASTRGEQPMTWGNWQLVGKIRVRSDLYNQYDPGFRVKNTGTKPDTGRFDVTLLDGKTVLGTAGCSTSLSLDFGDIPAGAVGSVTCESGDVFKRGWTEITIEDTYR